MRQRAIGVYTVFFIFVGVFLLSFSALSAKPALVLVFFEDNPHLSLPETIQHDFENIIIDVAQKRLQPIGYRVPSTQYIVHHRTLLLSRETGVTRSLSSAETARLLKAIMYVTISLRVSDSRFVAVVTRHMTDEEPSSEGFGYLFGAEGVIELQTQLKEHSSVLFDNIQPAANILASISDGTDREQNDVGIWELEIATHEPFRYFVTAYSEGRTISCRGLVYVGHPCFLFPIFNTNARLHFEALQPADAPFAAVISSLGKSWSFDKYLTPESFPNRVDIRHKSYVAELVAGAGAVLAIGVGTTVAILVNGNQTKKIGLGAGVGGLFLVIDFAMLGEKLKFSNHDTISLER